MSEPQYDEQFLFNECPKLLQGVRAATLEGLAAGKSRPSRARMLFGERGEGSAAQQPERLCQCVRCLRIFPNPFPEGDHAQVYWCSACHEDGLKDINPQLLANACAMGVEWQLQRSARDREALGREIARLSAANNELRLAHLGLREDLRVAVQRAGLAEEKAASRRRYRWWTLAMAGIAVALAWALIVSKLSS